MNDKSQLSLPRDRSILHDVKRVVIKLGTRVVMHQDGELALGRLHGIIEDIIALKRTDRQPILVSSGAIGLGAGRIGSKPRTLEEKQACAAIGQVLLMSVYEQAFSRFGIKVAQLLLTEHDFHDRTHYLNLRNTFHALLTASVIPIVNENDPVSIAEIEPISQRSPIFGDNDKLSALLTSRIDAEVLILLTDVDGVYTDPGPGRGGEIFDLVHPSEIEHISVGGASSHGRGGMEAKLQAVQVATDRGCAVIIANGKKSSILRRIFSLEKTGTFFLPKRRLSSKKHWIAFASQPLGNVTVTQGAREALQKRGASLLFTGVKQISGAFKRGDVLSICDEKGCEFARGMANHNSGISQKLIGQHSKNVAELTQEPNFEAFVHRDNLVLTKREYD